MLPVKATVAMLPQEELTAKAEPPPLLVDTMLGSLARRLRLLGFDAAFWSKGDDSALVRQARADGRIVVTRDRQVAARRGLKSIYIQSGDLAEQVHQMLGAISCRAVPFSRCLVCNGLLGEISHEDARALVPAYVWKTQSDFRRCTECRRVYWRGTHWQGLASHVRSALDTTKHAVRGDEMGATPS